MSDVQLSPEQVNEIARRAADIVILHFQAEVGKLTIRAFLYTMGALMLAILGWLGVKGVIKL